MQAYFKLLWFYQCDQTFEIFFSRNFEFQKSSGYLSIADEQKKEVKIYNINPLCSGISSKLMFPPKDRNLRTWSLNRLVTLSVVLLYNTVSTVCILTYFMSLSVYLPPGWHVFAERSLNCLGMCQDCRWIEACWAGPRKSMSKGVLVDLNPKRTSMI